MFWRRFLLISGRRFRIRIPVVITLALGGINAVAQTTTNTVTRTFTFPAIGLGPSETAQVNVVNQSGATSSGTATSCSGTIAFMNSSGAAIGSATPYSDVTSGQIFSATLPFSSFSASSSRQVFRAVVTLVETLGEGLLPCSLGVSLETYDTASGVTHAVLTAAQVVPALLGPVGPLVPVARSQR
jgi:hypothetical protein